jgi:hypothetical protein
MSDNRLNRRSSFAQFALFVSLITIVSLKGFFRQDVLNLPMIYKNKTNNKVSIVSTKDTNIIVGVASHDKNIHDSKTLTVAISHANDNIIIYS